MKLKSGFVLRDVCGEQVIMGEGLAAMDFGKLLCLNETAAFLWKKAESLGEFSLEDLAQALTEEYEVSLEEATEDVSSIIDEWQKANVLQ